MKPNFKKLDSEHNFKYKGDLVKKIKELGYSYISEYIYIEYYTNKKSMKQIAKKINRTYTSVQIWMIAWKWHRRKRGGANFKGKYNSPEKIKEILSYRGKILPRLLAPIIGISKPTIYKIWRTY